MKQTFPHKEGDTLTIYKDWEHESEVLGTARLKKFHKAGRSFILEEMLPESKQIVYSYQEWYVDWIMISFQEAKKNLFIFEKPVKIRYIDTIGLSNSAEDDTFN